MKSTLFGGALLLAMTGALAAPAAAQQAPALRIDLNIPALRLAVYEGDELVGTYGVAVGKSSHPTPTGEFTMGHAEWNPWWRPPPGREWTRGKENTPPGPDNPMGRVKLFFAPLYFIHGTPEAESIGSPASHGCVRMRNADVIELARLVHQRAAPGISDQQIDRILAQPRSTRAVHFESPVQVVIRYEPIVVEDGMLRIYPDLYGYNRIHTEAVYQALLTAGYDIHTVDRDVVRSLLERASEQKGSFAVEVSEAFPGLALAAGSAAR